MNVLAPTRILHLMEWYKVCIGRPVVYGPYSMAQTVWAIPYDPYEVRSEIIK